MIVFSSMWIRFIIDISLFGSVPYTIRRKIPRATNYTILFDPFLSSSTFLIALIFRISSAQYVSPYIASSIKDSFHKVYFKRYYSSGEASPAVYLQTFQCL